MYPNVYNTEQLEAFKKHMEAGETNTPAIIMGEENEDDTENGQLNDMFVCVQVKWWNCSTGWTTDYEFLT